MEIKKYTFQTIVAPQAVRADFTALRDQLDTSDKTLMQALWNISIDHIDALKLEVINIEASIQKAREEQRELKVAAKPKKEAKVPKAPKASAKPKKEAKKEVATKSRKKKVTAKDMAKFEVVYDASLDQ
jgi:hypothetical protein